MKRWVHATTIFPSPISFARGLVSAIEKETNKEVTCNMRYNDICVHDIVNLRTLFEGVCNAVENLGYRAIAPESEDYVAVVKDNRYIKLYISDYLEADNEYNGYVSIDFKECNLDVADWA